MASSACMILLVTLVLLVTTPESAGAVSATLSNGLGRKSLAVQAIATGEQNHQRMRYQPLSALPVRLQKCAGSHNLTICQSPGMLRMNFGISEWKPCHWQANCVRHSLCIISVACNRGACSSTEVMVGCKA